MVDLLGLTALVAVLVLVALLGALLRACDGRIRAGTAEGGWGLAGVAPGAEHRVPLLQLSAPDVARTLNVLRTPTVVPSTAPAASCCGCPGCPGRPTWRPHSRPRWSPGDPDRVRWAGARSRNAGSSATLGPVFWPLTRRRAVDLCRVGSCLCRAS